jgi:peroxiredoxin Q/BCP
VIQVGDRAPDFSGTTADGETISLAGFRGRKPVILYFYPKDNTPGCTREACGFRDLAGEIAAAGGALVGVSMDGPEAHRRFAAEHRLDFPLVSDASAAICKAYGVARLGGWLWPRRVTFVIDRDGIVRRVIESELDMSAHVDGAVAALRDLARGHTDAPTAR